MPGLMGRIPPFDPREDMTPWLRGLSFFARQPPVTWFLVNVGNRIDPFLMKATGGRIKSTISSPTVLLKHTGAASNKVRETPLAYLSDGERVILIASAGGAPRHPSWYFNILANPEVELWAKGKGGRYRAEPATGAERERLWKIAVDFYPGFQNYQERAHDRVIPVVVCSPLDA
jgi:deazaflavin-dependent oxidoreductase (nitroreductase family)